MEVVGLIASVIAIGKTLSAVPKIIHTLNSLSEIKNELASLVNELETLRASHEQIRALIDLLSADLEAGHGTDEHQSGIRKVLLSAAEPLRRAALQLETIMPELEKLQQSCCRGVDNEARPQPRKIKWLWKRSQVENLYVRVRDLRLGLQLPLNAITIFTLRSQSTLLFEIRAVTRTSARTIEQNFQDIRNHVEASESNAEPVVETEMQSLQCLSESLGQLEVDNITNSLELTHEIVQDPEATDIGANNYLSIETSVRGICRGFCRCQCHIKKTVTSYEWLRPILGSFFLRFNGIPALALVKCNERGCNRQSSALRFNYYFPSWLLSRALSFSLDAGSMTNAGAMLHFSLPRILDCHDLVWPILEYGKPSHFQQMIRLGRTYHPTDVAVDDVGLIEQAVKYSNYATLKCLMEFFHNSLRKTLSTSNLRAIWYANERLEDQSKLTDSQIYLLKKLASLAADSDDSMALAIHVAITAGHNKAIREAIQAEPWTVNSLDHLGRSPLHLAVRANNVEAVEELISAQANVDLKNAFADTPLMTAVRVRNIGCVKKLINARCNIDAANNQGSTAIHLAASYGCLETLELLVLAKASVVCVDVFGSTPLHSFAVGWPTKARERAALLWRAGAELNAGSEGGATPLMAALKHNNLQSLQALVDAGARLDAVDNWGNGFLHLAAMHSDAEALEYFINLDIEATMVEHKDKEGDTPWDCFHYAITVEDWQRGGLRKPLQKDIDAFVRLYTKLRNQLLETDIAAMAEILEDLSAQEWDKAIARLNALVKQKTAKGKPTETLETIRLQIRNRMIEAAVEALEENIEILKERQLESPWEQKSRFDPPSEVESDQASDTEDEWETEDDSEADTSD